MSRVRGKSANVLQRWDARCKSGIQCHSPRVGAHMDRRHFLKSSSLLTVAAAAAGLPRLGSADTADASWRIFEVTTRVQVLDAEGLTRVWLPTPLTIDTDYFKNLGNTWSVE